MRAIELLVVPKSTPAQVALIWRGIDPSYRVVYNTSGQCYRYELAYIFRLSVPALLCAPAARFRPGDAVSSGAKAPPAQMGTRAPRSPHLVGVLFVSDRTLHFRHRWPGDHADRGVSSFR